MSKAVKAEAEAPVTTEPTYSVAEFASASKRLFGTTPDIVTAALKASNKLTATIEEAKQIVEAFKNKEVK